MKKIYCFLILTIFLSGCATKMAYLNTKKPAEEVQKDKADCQSIVDVSDYKDADLKQKKFNQCMKDKGYNVVSEEEAEKIQGFKELWVKPGVDFKAYEAIFIDKVDLSRVKVKNSSIPDNKVSNADIENLGEEMLKRFSKMANAAMPVISAGERAGDKKILCMSLKLNNISQTNIAVNAVLEAVGEFVPAPLPDAPKGSFSFEGTIFDSSSKEKLITISDEVTSDKNSSIAGFEKFSHWQKAFNVMDYWADHLAELLAKVRGQEYKSQLGIKIF